MGISDLLTQIESHRERKGLGYALKHTWHKSYLGGLRRINHFFPRGSTQWEQDWDILIILDACRVDIFREVCSEYPWLPSKKEIEILQSVASSSKGWMERMFAAEYQDMMANTGYITANMFYQEADYEKFGFLWPVEPDYLEEYELLVTHPDKLTDRAISTWRKREELGISNLIVHYMQPHTPFRSAPEWFDHKRENKTSWGEGFLELRDGEIDQDEFRDAYVDNLRWVLDSVETLTKNCDAKIALSADHGNGLGEWGVYGHPDQMPVSAVREVPYVCINGADTGDYTPESDPLKEQPELTTDETREHLQHLGYIE